MRRSLEENGSHFVEMAGLKSEGRACSSLLATICDAHLFLDSNLCLEADAPSLASMLFHSVRNRGAAFPQYIVGEDQARFLEAIADEDEHTSLAQVMHVHLRDGVGNHVPVEMFLVKAPIIGKQRHLLGLREYADRLEKVPASTPPINTQHKPDQNLTAINLPHSESDQIDESDGSARGESEDDRARATNGSNSDMFILFDANHLEILRASKKLLNKVECILTEETTVLDLVAPVCREDLAEQLASHVMVIYSERVETHEAMVTFAMNHRKVAKQRYKTWKLHLQSQFGRVIGHLELQDRRLSESSWRMMRTGSQSLPPVLETERMMSRLHL